MLTLTDLLDDAKCYDAVRQYRWADGVACPHCGSKRVNKRGKHDKHPERQRYCCEDCKKEFDDLTGSIFSGRHQPLRVWVSCLYLMGLNISNQQIAKELNLHKDDVQKMTSKLRQAVVDKKPEVQLAGEVEFDEVYVTAGHKGHPEAVKKKVGRGGVASSKGYSSRSKLRGRGTLETEKPPVFGMIARGGDLVIRMLENVQQTTIEPIIKATVVTGTLIFTDEYNIYSRLESWGFEHKTVCHSTGEYARDEDGDGFCEVHVNTIEGVWSLLRSWLRPHRGISQEKLPIYLGFFEFMHNARKRGKALLGSLLKTVLA